MQIHAHTIPDSSRTNNPATGNGPTNVAFDDGEKPSQTRRARDVSGATLYISMIKDVSDPQCNGSIVKISNVK